MGNGHAIRSAHLPDDINSADAFEFEKLGWDDISILANSPAPGPQNTAIPINSLHHAGKFTQEYFAEVGEELKILEVFAGNRSASVAFADAFEPGIDITNWVVTDAVDYPGAEPINHFCKMDAVSAVNTYGPAANVLLMIAAPKNYADYYSLRNFIAQKSEFGRRWFIFIGELGGEHGSPGMWNYCHTNINLRRVLCESIVLASEKKIYIFEITGVPR